MRLLIDGYNLMYAVVAPDGGRRPQGLRRDRQRFLNELAARLGPVEAALTTVVFDAAADAPEHLPRATRHKGLTVLFAKGDDDADARLETLIAQHSAPKTLTVVSTDHRVRRAALRRRAKSLTSDEFWTQLQDRRRPRPVPPPPAREEALNRGTSDYWMGVFADVIASPEAHEVFEPIDSILTDEDIRRIADEVRREG